MEGLKPSIQPTWIMATDGWCNILGSMVKITYSVYALLPEAKLLYMIYSNDEKSFPADKLGYH